MGGMMPPGPPKAGPGGLPGVADASSQDEGAMVMKMLGQAQQMVAQGPQMKPQVMAILQQLLQLMGGGPPPREAAPPAPPAPGGGL